MDALKSLAELAASNIEDSLPQLWNLHISGPLKAERIDDISSFQPAIQACFLLKGLCPCIVDYQALDQILKNLVSWLKVDNMAVQTSVSTALSCIIAKDVSRFLPGCLGGLGAILKDGSLEPCRFGGIIALRNILTSIGAPIIPYVPLIVVYIMRRMSDSSQRVRSLAAQAFATAVTLMPLAQGADVPQCLSDDQKEMVKNDGNFLEQLLNNEHVDDYKLPFELLTGSLRRYQQEGINWLAFLKRFGLHGVLADDMGLGMWYM
jgi:TATA-binding protein-associated factor